MAGSFYKTLSFYNNTDQYFYIKPTFVFSIREANDQTLVPRFTLKDADIFKDFPANKELDYKPELLKKAIEYGMIIQMRYKGEEDLDQNGHERVIYPMVYGRTKKKDDGTGGDEVLRGYHLKGWSVSENKDVEKEWRMFRCDKIISITFTGAFYRLAPDGYNMDDKGIATKIAVADFNKIRNLQQSLLDQSKIDTQEHTILNRVNNLECKDLHWNMKLANPWENNIIPKASAKNIRVTFAKPVINSTTSSYICCIGISINPNTCFNFIVDGKVVGRYKSIKWQMAANITKQEIIDSRTEFKTYMFLKSN